MTCAAPKIKYVLVSLSFLLANSKITVVCHSDCVRSCRVLSTGPSAIVAIPEWDQQLSMQCSACVRLWPEHAVLAHSWRRATGAQFWCHTDDAATPMRRRKWGQRSQRGCTWMWVITRTRAQGKQEPWLVLLIWVAIPRFRDEKPYARAADRDREWACARMPLHMHVS